MEWLEKLSSPKVRMGYAHGQTLSIMRNQRPPLMHQTLPADTSPNRNTMHPTYDASKGCTTLLRQLMLQAAVESSTSSCICRWYVPSHQTLVEHLCSSIGGLPALAAPRASSSCSSSRSVSFRCEVVKLDTTVCQGGEPCRRSSPHPQQQQCTRCRMNSIGGPACFKHSYMLPLITGGRT